MGWTSNTADEVANAGPQISAVAVVFTTFSLIILLLRLYVRIVMIKAVGPDDYVLIVTWVAACGFAVVSTIQTKWGLGLENLEDMPPENVYNFGLIQYIGAPFYITSILGFKISLLLMYLRFLIIGIAHTATIVIIVACVIFHLSFLLVQTNLCQPAARQWDPAITWGKCLPAVPFYTSMASITIFFDITVMLLPFPILVQSQIQKRKKIALLGMLALGIFITIIQVIRIRTVKKLANYLDSASMIMWSMVENNLGITVASLPTLAPLFKYYMERTRKGSTNNSASHSWSTYALKPRRGTEGGSFPFSSNLGQATDIHGPSEEGGSEEFILGGLDTISKRVGVTVSTHAKEDTYSGCD